MLEDGFRRGRPFHRLWQFVRLKIIGDVPEDIGICEFDCRKGQCVQGEWHICDRRIRKGAGELYPDSRFGKP